MTGRHNIHAMLHYFTGYYFNQCVTQSSSLAKRVTFKETDQALNFIHAVVCLCYLGLPLDAQLFFFLCIKSSLTHIHTQNTFSQFYYIFDAQLFLRPHRVSHFCNYFPPQESHLRHRLTSFSISHWQMFVSCVISYPYHLSIPSCKDFASDNCSATNSTDTITMNVSSLITKLRSDVWLTVYRNSVWIRNQLDVTFV